MQDTMYNFFKNNFKIYKILLIYLQYLYIMLKLHIIFNREESLWKKIKIHQGSCQNLLE